MISLYIGIFKKKIESSDIFNSRKSNVLDALNFFKEKTIIEKLLSYLERKIETMDDPYNKVPPPYNPLRDFNNASRSSFPEFQTNRARSQ